VKSLFFSIVACFRNFWAYAVFALTWLGVLVMTVLVVTTLSTLLGVPGLAGDLLFPGLMMLTAMFFTSLYFTFRDTFEPPPETTP
jgi:hypothetical protein